MKNNLTKTEKEQCSYLISVRLEEVTAALLDAEALFMSEPIIALDIDTNAKLKTERIHNTITRYRDYRMTLLAMKTKYEAVDLTHEELQNLFRKSAE